MKEKIKKHKKLIIFFAGMAVIVIVAVAMVNRANSRRQAMMENIPTQDTAQIERRTLIESISATGTVTSVASKDVKADVTGVKVKTVNVKVGDEIKEGDIICILDSEGIEEDLADAQTSLSVTTQKTQIELSSSERSLNEAQESRNIELERADEDVAAAWNDYLEALTDLEEAENELNEAKQTTGEKNGEYEYRQELLEEAEEKMESLAGGAGQSGKYEKEFASTVESLKKYIKDQNLTLLDGAMDKLYITNEQLPASYDDIISVSDLIDEEKTSTINEYLATMIDLQTPYQQSVSADMAYQQAKAEYESLKAEVSGWQSKYNTAKSSEKSLETAYEQAISTADSKLDAYNQKVRSQEDTQRNTDSSVSGKEDSLATTRLNATTSGQSDKQKIKEYEDQIAECTVTAPISGIITTLNVEVGDSYSGTDIVTIEDTSDYEIETEIDEYDIGKVKEGQKVVIKTNGTGDKEFDGTVISIAPRATGGGSEVTYTVTASIDTPCEELKMDMTAKLSIILESKENILTVPYDSVQEDKDGSYYIEVLKEEVGAPEQAEEQVQPDTAQKISQPDARRERSQPDAMREMPQTEKIYVTKGIESDYYVEIISDEVEEGMTVIVPVSENEGMTIQQMMGNRGPMGGF